MKQKAWNVWFMCITEQIMLVMSNRISKYKYIRLHGVSCLPTLAGRKLKLNDKVLLGLGGTYRRSLSHFLRISTSLSPDGWSPSQGFLAPVRKPPVPNHTPGWRDVVSESTMPKNATQWLADCIDAEGDQMEEITCSVAWVAKVVSVLVLLYGKQEKFCLRTAMSWT